MVKSLAFSPKGADFTRFLEKVAAGQSNELHELLSKPLVIKIRKNSVVPRNLSQRRFLDLILSKDLVFGIGPAGTGKNFSCYDCCIGCTFKRRSSTHCACQTGSGSW